MNPISVSLIVPVLNEERQLEHWLNYPLATEVDEIIFVDGGSSDTSTQRIQCISEVRLLHSRAGRGYQLRAGAEVAKGEILRFAHCDSPPPEGALEAIQQTFKDPRVVAAAFKLKIQALQWKFRIISFVANVRARSFRRPYGDQGIAVRKSTVESTGDVPEVPIFEDILLMKALEQVAITRSKILSQPALD